MNTSENRLPARRREPITDTQLLLTITICIFVGMYVLAMLIWGGGFKKPQMIFDILNDNAFLIIISCGLTIVMITGSIDISVGGVTALVAMVGVMILNGNLGLFNGLIAALGLAESWRIVFAALMALIQIVVSAAQYGGRQTQKLAFQLFLPCPTVLRPGVTANRLHVLFHRQPCPVGQLLRHDPL